MEDYASKDYEGYCARWWAWRDSDPPSFERYIYWAERWKQDYAYLWSTIDTNPSAWDEIRTLEYWMVA